MDDHHLSYITKLEKKETLIPPPIESFLLDGLSWRNQGYQEEIYIYNL